MSQSQKKKKTNTQIEQTQNVLVEVKKLNAGHTAATVLFVNWAVIFIIFIGNSPIHPFVPYPLKC